MKCRVKGNSDKRGRPYAIRGVDEKPPAHASNAVTYKVGGQGDKQLVGEMGGIRLIKVLGKILHPDDVVRVWCVVCHVCHDGDEHVFLLGEGSGIKRMSDAEQREAFIRKPFLGCFANGIGQKLRNVGHDTNGGLTDVEKLVDKGQQDGKYEADCPATDG